MIGFTDEQLNAEICKWRVEQLITEKGIHPAQRPQGTEGYRGTDLSGMWILEDSEGFNYGMNCETAEIALQEFYHKFAARHQYIAGAEARHNLTECLKRLTGDDRSLFWDWLYLESEVTESDPFEVIWKCLLAKNRTWAIALLRVIHQELFA